MSTHHPRTGTARRLRHNNIAKVRRALGLRQLDLARRLDLYQGEISAIERGARIPTVYLARRIAKALRTNVDDLFARS